MYGSIKDQFQSLCEIRVQIQSEQQWKYVKSWIFTCLVLHNMIIEIEEDLGIASSAFAYATRYDRYENREEQEERGEEENEDEDGDEEGQGDWIGSDGQRFCEQLKAELLHHLAN